MGHRLSFEERLPLLEQAVEHFQQAERLVHRVYLRQLEELTHKAGVLTRREARSMRSLVESCALAVAPLNLTPEELYQMQHGLRRKRKKGTK
jgi:hypothetical protein